MAARELGKEDGCLYGIGMSWSWPLLFATAAAGCARTAIEPSWPASTTPVPAVFGLGEPCTERELQVGPLYQRCGKGGRVSTGMYRSYESVAGKWSHPPTCSTPLPGCEDTALPPPEHPEPPPMFSYPKTKVATITRARERGADGDEVNERVIYIDGPLLWCKVVFEYTEQFPGSVLMIVDRRLLNDGDKRFLHQALALPREIDIDDDKSLTLALRALPSLPPGKYGRLPEPDEHD